jgi:hypothetical protein
MAQVISPLGATAARGSYGGLVYNSVAGKQIVKSRTGHKRGHTRREQLAMRYLAPLRARWSLFPSDRRDAWRAFASEHPYRARWGLSKPVSGWNWFFAIGVLLGLAHLTDRDDPPEYLLTASCTSVLLQVLDQWITIYWTWSGPADTRHVYAEIYSFGPHKPSRNPNLRDARRYDSCPIADTIDFEAVHKPGYYTFWVRLFCDNGTATGWSWARIYVPPDIEDPI